MKKEYMKNEILARAITEIDDDLLAEAHEPVKKKKPDYRIIITRYAAAVAACFVLVFSLVFFGNYGRGGELDISVDGQAVSADGGKITLPLISVQTEDPFARSTKKITVPVKINADGKNAFVTASRGGAIRTESGEECEMLKVKSGADIEWVVDISQESRFELTVTSKKQTLIIRAFYDSEQECMILSAAEGEN